MTHSDYKLANVGGLQTACLTRHALVELISEKINLFKQSDAPRSFVISSSNGHSVSLYNRDDRTKTLLDDADLLHADGQSIVSMSKWASTNTIPERSATTDLFTDIPEYYSSSVRHYLLGGKLSSVSGCANIMAERYPNYSIAGYQDGYFDENATTKIIDEINKSCPDILWVGLGKPKEQEFVYKYRNELQVPVIITCGGCFNYVTSEYKRAPIWMQNIGAEWLHRALTEPRKLLWRYLTTNPHAVYCAFKHSRKNKQINMQVSS
jgi:exopolysaccharide biosynthesis WecB/TagA/CpsF family protein